VPTPSKRQNRSSQALSLILVGMRGSGKTTVGRMLALKLDVPFVDTDDLVEERAATSIEAIFRDQGESVFRTLEQEAIASLEKPHEILVVATGGGAVLDPGNRRILAALGTVVFLDAPAQILTRRIRGSQRPSLLKLNLDEEITVLLDRRRPLYMDLADFVLDATEPVDHIVAAITDIWLADRTAVDRTRQPKGT